MRRRCMHGFVMWRRMGVLRRLSVRRRLGMLWLPMRRFRMRCGLLGARLFVHDVRRLCVWHRLRTLRLRVRRIRMLSRLILLRLAV
jgi:hypothetical protein